MLQFNAELHQYKQDGKILPSVTQVIKAAGLCDFSTVNEGLLKANADFGTAVHSAVRLVSIGKLDTDVLDPNLRPYLAAWESFVKMYQFKSELQEHQVADPVLKYAGTIDQIGKIKEETTIADLKSGVYKLADVIQLCAYGKLYPAKRLLLVYLTPGKFKVLEIKGQDRIKGTAIFQNALNLYHYRHEKGLL